MASSLQLRGVEKSFGSLRVLNQVSLEVAAGEFVAILGNSGGGKTTLLRMIAGFDAPEEGEIRIGDRVVFDSSTFVPAEQRRVGVVPQDAALFPHLTAAEDVGFGLQALAKPERAQRVAQLLDLVAMSGFAEYLPAQLSGGQRHRIALARALAPNPDVILLDEPFAALDPELRGRIREDVRRVLNSTGSTVVLVTHDQEEALSIADRVAVLRDGEIAQVGSPRDIYSEPADIGIATFLGDSVIVDGVVEGGKIVTSLGQLTPLNQVFEGARGKVAIRPENFYLQPNVKGDAVVVNRQFFGHDAVVEVKTPQTTVRARASGPFAPEIGMKVTVWVRGAVNFYAE